MVVLDGECIFSPQQVGAPGGWIPEGNTGLVGPPGLTPGWQGNREVCAHWRRKWPFSEKKKNLAHAGQMIPAARES